MSVKSTLMAVCMEEPAMILSISTRVAVTSTAETTARSYLTSVLCLLISVPMVFATMTTTSPLQSVCATSPTVWVSWTNNKLFFCSTGCCTGFSKHINCTFLQNPCTPEAKPTQKSLCTKTAKVQDVYIYIYIRGI